MVTESASGIRIPPNWPPFNALLPANSPEAISAVLLDLFALSGKPETVEICAGGEQQGGRPNCSPRTPTQVPTVLSLTHPRTQSFLQRSPWSCFGCLHLLDKEDQPHTLGIRSDLKRFKTRQKTEPYVAQQVTPGQTPLSTDGSASLASGSAERCVYLTRDATHPP